MTVDTEGQELSTEEQLMENIGEGNEQTSTEGTGEEDKRTSTSSQEQTQTTNDQQSVDKGDGGQQEQQQTRGPQDLVDRNGNVVAKGGAERRHYERAQTEARRADTATQELETVKAQLKAINDAGTVGTQYGLTPEEVTTGAQLLSQWKQDPIATIKYMLTQAQSLGHNIETIASGGTDMSAVKNMLDTALAPLIKDRTDQIDTQARNDEVIKIYNDFTARHPDAAVHEDTLAQLIQQDKSLSVDAAFYKLQTFYATNGYDWTKSLATLQKEHEEAKAKGNNVEGRSQPPDGNNVNTNNVTDTSVVAPVSESTDDIIKQAMRDSGMSI
jgi:hypothetical protein